MCVPSGIICASQPERLSPRSRLACLKLADIRFLDVLAAGSVSDDDVAKPSEGKTIDEWSLIQMAGRMEIISLHEISLAKFLGSGGYGEVSHLPCDQYSDNVQQMLSRQLFVGCAFF